MQRTISVGRSICVARAIPVHPQFLHTYVEHVCPLKQSTLVRDHLGKSCIDDLIAPPLIDQVEITRIVMDVDPSIRGLLMDLLIRGEDSKAAFILQNADVLRIVSGLFQEAMQTSDP